MHARTHPEHVMILGQDIRFAVPETLIDALQNFKAGVVPSLALVDALDSELGPVTYYCNSKYLMRCQMTRDKCKLCEMHLQCN